LENHDDVEVDINRLGKVLERIYKLQPQSLDYFELKQHKPIFDDECSKLYEQRKQ
jgi:hypothetical protein